MARQFKYDRPRPQVLLLGLDADEDRKLQDLFPGAKVISRLSEAHQKEWDLLVARHADLSTVDPSLFVVSFGGTFIGTPGDMTGSAGGIVIIRSPQAPSGQGVLRSVATKFVSPDGVPTAFSELIATDLVSLLEAEGAHSCLFGYRPSSGPAAAASLDLGPAQPLIQGSDGVVYAATFTWANGPGRCVTLPAAASLDWVLAATNYFHTVDRQRFPASFDWKGSVTSGVWLTPDEIVAMEAYQLASAAAADAQRRAAEAWEAFQTRQQTARGQGAFRMLAEQGQPLADSVRDAMLELGFIVRDMDQERAANDFLEDLRVSPPGDPEWVALVEVKGYTRGRGKADDLMNLTGRFARRFRDEEGREPSAYWYVLNHEFGSDPNARKLAFEGHDGEVSAFASVGGLVIETRQLFRLWRDVASGVLGKDTAQELLTASTGRFVYGHTDGSD